MKWPAWIGVGERTYKQPDGTVVQPSKTAWDWLQLLIVPAVLAGAGRHDLQPGADKSGKQPPGRRGGLG